MPMSARMPDAIESTAIVHTDHISVLVPTLKSSPEKKAAVLSTAMTTRTTPIAILSNTLISKDHQESGLVMPFCLRYESLL